MVERRARAKAALDAAIGSGAVALMRAVKLTDRRRAANLAGATLRRVGPLLKEHRLGHDNLHAAFPEKSDTEIETILAGVWDNLGRVAAEFVHLDEFHVTSDSHDPDAIMLEHEMLARCRQVIGEGRPTLSFACHTANWEISAVVAKQLGANGAVLYRRPNIGAIGDAVLKLRTGVMGQMIPTGLDAPVRLAHLLQQGVSVGMLVDQHFTKGVEVNFFGRPCKANPLIAVLARQVECPIIGLRVIRLPDGNRFRGEVTAPLELPRDTDGRIDVKGTMQVITAVIEGWVRDCPEQWLWLHRRWR
jgi:Kdo2-lipid IVA lauroyltransferase/acyltransferase